MIKVEDVVLFEASAHTVYELIVDTKKHIEFSKRFVKLEKKIGGKCNWYNSMYGEYLELEQDKKIVHTWRSNEWPEKHYAKVTFELEEVNNTTKLVFTLENIPNIAPYNTIPWKKGWDVAYWKPMREWIKKRGEGNLKKRVFQTGILILLR